MALLQRNHALLPAGVLAVVAVAAAAQQPPTAQVAPPRPPAAPADSQTLVVMGNTDWIERASVASKRPGVVRHIELTLGMDAKKNDQIAFLDADMAILERERALLQAKNNAGVEKAQAQKDLALANMARAKNILDRIGRDGISIEEYQTKEAELKLADATVLEEREKLKIAQKELELAEQAVQEHIIKAPFDGEILEVHKQPGSAVQAMEPVVDIGRTDQIRFIGWIPLESAYRLQKGMIVDVSPVIEGIDHPVEKKRFRGKLVSVGFELSSSRTRAEVQIKADILNNTSKELRVGHKAQMTIYLDPSQVPPPPADMLPEKAKEAPPVLGLSPEVSPTRPTQARASR